MEQQRNACPSRQGAGHLDETIGQGAVGYERAMIEFIQLWHRFGGGPARDIFVEFGLAEHEFFSRTLELLQTGLFAETTDETVEYIRKVCRWRVSTAGS